MLDAFLRFASNAESVTYTQLKCCSGLLVPLTLRQSLAATQTGLTTARTHTKLRS
jgi:hypothetical protein